MRTPPKKSRCLRLGAKAYDRSTAIDIGAQTKHPTRIYSGTTKEARPRPERAKAILEEVHKLVDAGIIREVFYHDWLSNPVMVTKSEAAGGCV